MENKEYDIQETIIAKKMYKTKDGKSFDDRQEAYEHTCELFVQDMIENIQKLNTTDFEVKDLFRCGRYIKHIKFETKKEALMFLDDYTKHHEYFKNSQEIKQQVQERKDFPCVICWSYNELLFKENLIDRIENVLNTFKEEL